MLLKYSEFVLVMRPFNEEQDASTKALTLAVQILENNSILGSCPWLCFTASLTCNEVHDTQPLPKHEIGVHKAACRSVFESRMETKVRKGYQQDNRLKQACKQ